ncbi:PREDICTED: killer cell lectin-like receptor subfamily F member 2 [Chrysochloris asiatica]|uniref:Killer cell lectin-like receptor subfamily F member 2 n=1 Tax=Chrysochloris asiatica TaxID=185453 RepID=A0A9B0U8Q9_CHRAS|nr:PREDICTED: killer cell lectin-like receptor subfamily F member 2 [Chrysochloris asiatica]
MKFTSSKFKISTPPKAYMIYFISPDSWDIFCVFNVRKQHLLFHCTDKNTDFPQKVNTSSLTGNNYKCSSDWLLNQGKCYWFSTSFKTWKESQHDCEKLQAHLLVIHDLKELIFIQNTIKPGHLGWIGLHITSEGNLWTWIDEHFLDPQLFLVIGPTDEKSCAIMTGSQVYSEDCNSRFNGICQKDTV